MEFKVPVIVNAKPKRAKQEKIVVAAVTRVIDIPEVRSIDAPVVVSSFFPGDEDDDGFPILREFRELDGQLYVDFIDDAPFVTAPRLRLSDRSFPPFQGLDRHFREAFRSMQPSAIKNAVYPAATADEIAKSKVKTFVDLETLGLSDIDTTMLDRCLELFEREAGKLLIVDGKMHLRERSPVIEVGVHISTNKSYTELKPVRRMGDGPVVLYNDADSSGGFTTPLAFFQIDQAEEAIAFAQSFGNPIKMQDLGDITLTEETAAIACNTASLTVNAVAVDMNNSISWMDTGLSGRQLLNRLSVNVMHAYHRLEAMLPGIDDENVPEELVDVVEGVLRLPREEREMFVPQERVEPMMWAATQLWHDRPVDLSFAKNTWTTPRRK